MTQPTHRMSIFTNGLKIIEVLLTAGEPMTVKAISSRSGIHQRSVYRYLNVLDKAFHPRLRAVGDHPAKWYLES
jgi:predicted DNA-binding transcriptional regulator YafY